MTFRPLFGSTSNVCPRAGKGGLAGLDTALHPGASSAHSLGHVKHSALSVPALAQADANAKVASWALRAGHDDIVCGPRRGRPGDRHFDHHHVHFCVAANKARAQTRISYTLRAQFPACGSTLPMGGLSELTLRLAEQTLAAHARREQGSRRYRRYRCARPLCPPIGV